MNCCYFTVQFLCGLFFNVTVVLAAVVQNVDGAIHRINHYLVGYVLGKQIALSTG